MLKLKNISYRPFIRFYNKIISIDTSNLIQKTYDKDRKEILSKKELETPLIRHIRQRIKASGPLSIAAYMMEALLNNEYGYYFTNKQSRGIFGSKGDFITSPEISPIFSEIVGMWCILQWENLGKPKKFKIIELGPGRGVLMRDLLNATSKFPDFNESISNIHLIEVSPVLKNFQKQNLSKYNNCIWNDRLRDVQTDEPVIVIAHEFFDALPVYHFHYTERGWCEVLIDVDDSTESKYHFRFVLAPAETIASRSFVKLLNVENEIGAQAEISPASIGEVQEIATLISKNRGSCLIVDYGKEDIKGVTLRGIKDHKFESVLASPGEVDLSAFVNFGLLRKSIQHLNVNVEKLQNQSDFLIENGIDARMIGLLQLADDDKATRYIADYKRLVEDMGEEYKVLTINKY